MGLVERAIAAVEDAIASGIPGVLGIHIEGPFLNPAKKGIHDEAKFRRIEPDMLDMLSALRGGRTLVTLAPERAAAGMVERLTERGILVCAGHTAATYEEVQPALAQVLSSYLSDLRASRRRWSFCCCIRSMTPGFVLGSFWS